MTAVLDTIAWVCLVAGALLSLSAGVALLRFPDLLSRMHAATKPQVLGLLLVLIGCALRLRELTDITTLLLVVVFQMATAPVAAHMVGRAAYRAGRCRSDLLVTDELAGVDTSGSDTGASADVPSGAEPAAGSTSDDGTSPESDSPDRGAPGAAGRSGGSGATGDSGGQESGDQPGAPGGSDVPRGAGELEPDGNGPAAAGEPETVGDRGR